VSTEDESRQAKKQSVEREEAAAPRREKTANADDASTLIHAPTQGHRKALQRVEDLWQNEEFRAELATIQAIPDWRKRSKRLFKFAEENNLELFVGSPLMGLLLNEKRFLEDPTVDVCQIVDRVDEMFGFFNYEDYETPPKPLPDRKLSIMLHPINICISPMASKRDVLDFVTKRWGEIRDLLDMYSVGEPAVRKRRKAARDQFILEHWEVPSKELADMVCEEFPGELLTYADINAIRQYLKKRYSKT